MKHSASQTRTCRKIPSRVIRSVIFSALLVVASLNTAKAQVAPSLGTAESFAVLGASTVTNTGPTIITGDLGVSPGTAITGFPPGTVVGGATHAADAVALQAQSDNTAAYNQLAGQACNTTFGVPTDIGGMTLVPGVYCFASSAGLTGALTLNAQGNPNAVFIFDIGSTLITASNASVVLINGAEPCNVFWKVGSSATLGTGTVMIGNILALTSISLTTNATLSGRALAQNGAVTMDSNTVSVTSCSTTSLIPPTINKVFSPATILAGAVSTLTITLNNANTSAASLTSPLTDSLPSGVVVSGGGSTTCGGTVTAIVGSSSVTLTGGSIPIAGSCTLTVDVTAAAAGTYINSLSSGALQTSNGSNVTPAVATLVATSPTSAPPTVNKAFAPGTIVAGSVSTLTITLSNPDTMVASLTSPLTDNLPSGLTVSGNASTTCGGTVTANTGSSSVTLTGGSIPASGSCSVTVDVTAAVAGSYFNSLPAGALQTGNGSNTQPAVATITVNAIPVVPPTLSKAFAPGTIVAGGVSTLTITLNNPDSVVASLTAPLIDHLPSGITVSGNASTTCGGAVTAITGSTSVTLTGGSIPADGSCTITVGVTSLTAGSYINSLSSGALQTSNGNNSKPAVATVVVTKSVQKPVLNKSFSPNRLSVGATSKLTITLTNPDSKPARLTAPFTDHLPTGMVVFGSAQNTCGGTLIAAKGSSSLTLTGGLIPANGSCMVSVLVTATCAVSNQAVGMRPDWQNGSCTFTNTLPACSLHTSNGCNVLSTVATVDVAKAVEKPQLSKSFSPSRLSKGADTILTINFTNTDSLSARLTAPFTDHLPNGMVVVGSAKTTCGGTLKASKGSSSVTLTGGAIPAFSSCKVTVSVTASCSASQTNAALPDWNNGSCSFTNTLPTSALQTSNGPNSKSAVATLTVAK
jgi:Ice-binding-like